MKKTFSQFDNIFFRMRMGTCVAFLVCSFPVFAQEAGQAQDNQSSDTVAVEKPKTEEVVLPGAEVRAQKETAEHISQEQMTERGDTNLLEAIRWVPGIIINGGGHAGKEQGGFSIRGATGGAGDQDYMSVFVDGVPLQANNEGRVDYGSLLTGGLESIEVAKGYSSGVLGPGAIGGALILRTAKPKRPLEISARSSFSFDGGAYAGNVDNIAVGTRQGMFYARAGFQGSFIDHWRLPESFEPTDNTPPEQGGNPQKTGNRIFSGSTTIGANAMVGFTPLDTLDIWLTYSYSDKDKDWTSPATSGSYTMAAYPYLRRNNAAFHVEWTPPLINLSLRVYFDALDDRRLTIGGSDNAAKWTNYLNNNYSYRESEGTTWGVNLGGGYTINDWSNVQVSLQFKQAGMDTYYSRDNMDPPQHSDYYRTSGYRDNTWFAGAEYSVNPFKPFTAVVGFCYDIIDPQSMVLRDGTTFADNVTNPFELNALPQWTLGLFYDLSEQHELHLTYAKKNRFPDWRYRQQHANSSTQKPNLELGPEEMHHFELGYKGYFLESIRFTTALYASYFLNGISTVQLDNDPDGYTSQRQNVGENLYYGAEFGTEMFLNQYFTVGAALDLLKYKIISNPVHIDHLGGRPELSTNAYFSITPFANMDTGLAQNIRIIPRFEYVASMYDLASANATNLLAGYMLLHLNLIAEIAKHYSVSFAIYNMLDELYYTFREHPSPGRSFNISLGAKF
ncbi:MAG: TonB-dependent receptor plug domain-containing protein [Spirochaetaceae bacterium]|jgi:iron complex outermembrane receptor protein|nr:TonB-dependent receptor plug domain-containing protein [Spirochaetaceae bacterium]